ncbi:hypothetical protein EC973_000319 [Apophysomyces ossiformis]|uniref:Uncharacterized protein n=1 Tax=Apophysomyces ossiformis TaxID=679940 RepID=A0A8H7BJB7_9FUNG|nr:hypothetical protein EC973_000319 [Apophysomyces ossiformis]
MEAAEQIRAVTEEKRTLLSKACDSTLAKLGERGLSTYNKKPLYVTFQQPTEILQNTVLHYLTFDRQQPWRPVTDRLMLDIKTNTVQSHVAPFVDYRVEITRDRPVYPSSRGLKLRSVDEILKDENFLRGEKRSGLTTQTSTHTRRPETAPAPEEPSAVQKLLAQMMTSRQECAARQKMTQQNEEPHKKPVQQQKSLPETSRKTPQTQTTAKKPTKKTSADLNTFKKPAPIGVQRTQAASNRTSSNAATPTSKLQSAQTKSTHPAQRTQNSTTRVTPNATTSTSKSQSATTKSSSQTRKKSKRSLKISEHPDVFLLRERLGQDHNSDPLLSRTIATLREKFGKKKSIRPRPVLRLHISLSSIRSVKRPADEELFNNKAQQRPRIDTQNEEARPRHAGKRPTVYTDDPRSKFNMPAAAIPKEFIRSMKIPKRPKPTAEKVPPATQSQAEAQSEKHRATPRSEPEKRSSTQSKHNDVELEEGETISGDEREEENRHTSRRVDDSHRHSSRRDSHRYSDDKITERQQKRREERDEDGRRHSSRRDSRHYSDDKLVERQTKRREDREEDSRRHASRRESRHHSDDKVSERQIKRRESERHDDDDRRRKRSRHREEERQDRNRTSSGNILSADERQDENRGFTTSSHSTATNANRRQEESRSSVPHTSTSSVADRRHNDKRPSTTYPNSSASSADKKQQQEHMSASYPNSNVQNADKQRAENRSSTTNSTHSSSNGDQKQNDGNRASAKTSNNSSSHVVKQSSASQNSATKADHVASEAEKASTTTTFPNPTAPNAESYDQLRVFSLMFQKLATAHKRRGDQADSEIKCILDHFHAFLNYILSFYFCDKLGMESSQKNWETLHPFGDVLRSKLRARKEMELYGLFLRMKALVYFHTFSRREATARQNIASLHGKEQTVDRQKIEDYSKDADRTFNEYEQAYSAFRESEKYLSFLDIQTKFPESFQRVCIKGEPGPGIVLGGEAGTTVGPMFPLTPYSRLHHACIMAKCILSEYTTVQKLNYHYITDTDDFM